MLTNSSGTNYSLNDHKDVGQYGPYATPSDVMPCDSHPASLVNQNEIPIDLLRYRAHLALIMSLISMEMLTNIAHLQYHPR